MGQAIEEQMLEALEYFQYSYRFRNALFVLAFEANAEIGQMLTDLKILQVSHISPVIVCYNQSGLARRLEALDRRGLGSKIFYCGSIEELTAQTSAFSATIAEGRIPVAAFDFPQASADNELEFSRAALELSHSLAAQKLFFLSDKQGLEVGNKLQSHLSSKEAKKLLSSKSQLNISESLLRLIIDRPTTPGFEVVILQSSAGTLFQEIFTHLGRGTLFTDEYPNVIRQAQLADIVAITALHKPYVASGVLRSVSEDEIATEIDSYFIFTINQGIVGSAKLSQYGSAAELAKFCTLPRFQGRGRAKKLALHLVELARELGKQYVFALSIEPKMWAFFISLGFCEVARESLPWDWQKDYDFSRPSKALKLEL